ncbi:MAG: glycosyltransferase family 2 protein [Anaerolineae bacterium]
MKSLWIGVFWVCAGTIAYVYLGYPLIMALWARLAPRPHERAEILPPISLIIPAYNEAGCIIEKLRNSLALSYPPDRLEILVATDGSTDGTEQLASSVQDPRIHLLHQPQRLGKAAALARAARLAHGELLVFTDANAMLSADALMQLVPHFADPSVGAVGGVKRVQGGDGEGLYWRYENALKRWESAVGSVMGVPGELWAVRAKLYEPLPPGTILDDWAASMRLVAQGWRVLHVSEAIAYEAPPTSLRASWERRVRIAAGGWQGILRLGGPMRFASLATWWQCVSHRGLRWMVVPWLWLPLAIANIALASHPFYLAACLLQWLLYDMAFVGGLLASHGMTRPGLTAAFYLVFTNAAAAMGSYRYLAGKQPAAWRKVH